MRTRVPLAMLLGLALTFALHLWAIATALVRAHYGDDLAAYAQVIARWDQIARGAEWSAAVLLAAGWAELARRAHGRTRVLLSLVVLASWCAVAGLVAWTLVQMLVADPVTWGPWLNRVAIASGVVVVVQALLQSVATSAWRVALWAAIVIVVTTVVVQLPFVSEAVSHYVFIEHPVASAVVFASLRVAYVAGIYTIAARFADAHPRTSPPLVEARAGFALGGTAMWLRLVIAAGVLQYARATTEWAWAPVSAAVNGITLLALAWGALRVARDEVPGRVRLVLAGALCVWWAGVQAERAFLAKLIEAYGLGEASEPLAVIGPVVGLAAMVLVISAASSIATTRGDARLRELLLWLGIAMTGCALTGLWIGSHHEGEPAQLAIASLLGMLGIACVAYACHQTATSLGREPPVPPARVVS